MKYEAIKEKPKQFESLYGLSVACFDALHEDFSSVYRHYFTHFTFEGKERKRIKVFRKDGILSDTREALLFILEYIKNNPLQEYIAANYRLSQPQANLWIHLLTALLKETLSKNKSLPARSDRPLTEILHQISVVYIDGTERPVQRSTDYETQKEHFSGKKTTLRKK
jgi:hypothetical protein